MRFLWLPTIINNFQFLLVLANGARGEQVGIFASGNALKQNF